jgi:rare lipoprotein A
LKILNPKVIKIAIVPVAISAYISGVVVETADSSQTLNASYYGSELAGSPTACSGQPFNPNAMIAAHKSLPCGTLLTVSGPKGSAVVKIEDRGPFTEGRDLDLSEGAAKRIGLNGVGPVEVESTSKDEALPDTGGPE